MNTCMRYSIWNNAAFLVGCYTILSWTIKMTHESGKTMKGKYYLREFMESVFSEIGVAEFENEVFHKHHPVTILAGGRRSSKQHVACRVFFSFVGGYFPSPTTTNEKSKSLRIVAQRGLSEIEKG